MKLTMKNIDDIIQKEVEWCLDNPPDDLTEQQNAAFINGLRQAQRLIKLAESQVRQSEVNNE